MESFYIHTRSCTCLLLTLLLNWLALLSNKLALLTTTMARLFRHISHCPWHHCRCLTTSGQSSLVIKETLYSHLTSYYIRSPGNMAQSPPSKEQCPHGWHCPGLNPTLSPHTGLLDVATSNYIITEKEQHFSQDLIWTPITDRQKCNIIKTRAL